MIKQYCATGKVTQGAIHAHQMMTGSFAHPVDVAGLHGALFGLGTVIGSSKNLCRCRKAEPTAGQFRLTKRDQIMGGLQIVFQYLTLLLGTGVNETKGGQVINFGGLNLTQQIPQRFFVEQRNVPATGWIHSFHPVFRTRLIETMDFIAFLRKQCPQEVAILSAGSGDER